MRMPQEEQRPDDRRLDANTAVADNRQSTGELMGTGAAKPRKFAELMCQRLSPSPPETFPVVHRTDTATLKRVEVARRDGEVLLCDGCHTGDHVWPTGEAVTSRESGPD
jgi:hypothetical protein